MPVSEKTYRRIALEDPEGHRELHSGFLRRKPGMTLEHNSAATELLCQLRSQPDGTCLQTQQTSGTIQPFALPGVVIDLDTLFI